LPIARRPAAPAVVSSPGRSSADGETWPSREDVIPLHGSRVICRTAGITKARLQPENLDLHVNRGEGAVEDAVPRLELHSMVVFE
jgi:hypothetical protein